jgi:signal transduction histidine kinase
MKKHRRIWNVAFTAGVFVYFALVVSGTSFVTNQVAQALNRPLSSLLIQVISTLVGLELGAAILYCVGRVVQRARRDPRQNMFVPIVAALERIAVGDFDVRVSDTIAGHEVVGDLIASVNKLAVELGQVEQLRREFVSNVSHEIQSPLTSIRGFAQALRDEDLSQAERQRYLSIIETESTRLSRLSDNLLRLASLDSVGTPFERKTYRLDRQIREVILGCEPQWSAKGLAFEVALEEAAVSGDEDLLGQVWLNLIHNSIKFTPEGGNIRVCLDQRGGSIQFSIADSGVGIAEEDLPRIFERFYKADKSRQRSQEGSGLGLAIAKKIVELHDGTIIIESRVGQGSIFTVSLPARTAWRN